MSAKQGQRRLKPKQIRFAEVSLIFLAGLSHDTVPTSRAWSAGRRIVWAAQVEGARVLSHDTVLSEEVAFAAPPGIAVRLRTFHWPEPPIEVQWPRRPDHTMVMSLSQPRPRGAGYRADGPTILADLGPLYFMPAESEARFHGQGGLARVVTCTFSPDRFAAETGITGTLDDLDLYECMDFRDSHIANAMAQLAHELAAPGFASTVLVESLVLSIMVRLARRLEANRQGIGAGPGLLAHAQVRRIREILEDAPGKWPSVAALAEACNLSTGHLSRAFRRTTGQSLQEFIRQMHLRKAQVLMCQTDLPLKSIAYQLGFASPATFAMAFRKAVGQTPSSYRRAFRNSPVFIPAGRA
jgi:AraC family transcriptional regulator